MYAPFQLPDPKELDNLSSRRSSGSHLSRKRSHVHSREEGMDEDEDEGDSGKDLGRMHQVWHSDIALSRTVALVLD